MKNILSAREFVGWYNGVPRDKHLAIDLNNEAVVILGQGNVAVDAARMLLSPIDELKVFRLLKLTQCFKISAVWTCIDLFLLQKTDITEHALAALASSKVKTVYLVGRRGPLQVAFTIKELREMVNLKDCLSVFEKEHFKGIPEIIPSMA